MARLLYQLDSEQQSVDLEGMDGPSVEIDMQFAVHTRLVDVVAAAASATLGLLDGPASQKSRAVEAVAALVELLADDAQPSSYLDLAIVHDEEDVYLRLAVDTVADDLPDAEASRLVLAGLVDSADVEVEDGRAYAVAQFARIPSI